MPHRQNTPHATHFLFFLIFFFCFFFYAASFFSCLFLLSVSLSTSSLSVWLIRTGLPSQRVIRLGIYNQPLHNHSLSCYLFSAFTLTRWTRWTVVILYSLLARTFLPGSVVRLGSGPILGFRKFQHCLLPSPRLVFFFSLSPLSLLVSNFWQPLSQYLFYYVLEKKKKKTLLHNLTRRDLIIHHGQPIPDLQLRPRQQSSSRPWFRPSRRLTHFQTSLVRHRNDESPIRNGRRNTGNGQPRSCVCGWWNRRDCYGRGKPQQYHARRC